MPKKLKYSKKIETEATAFIGLITSYCSKINKEYVKHMNALIDDIAVGENLDPVKLKEKYLNKTNIKENDSNDSEVILDKIEQDGVVYYAEPEEDGNVYNTDSVVVGKIVNRKIVFLQ